MTKNDEFNGIESQDLSPISDNGDIFNTESINHYKTTRETDGNTNNAINIDISSSNNSTRINDKLNSSQENQSFRNNTQISYSNEEKISSRRNSQSRKRNSGRILQPQKISTRNRREIRLTDKEKLVQNMSIDDFMFLPSLSDFTEKIIKEELEIERKENEDLNIKLSFQEKSIINDKSLENESKTPIKSPERRNQKNLDISELENYNSPHQKEIKNNEDKNKVINKSEIKNYNIKSPLKKISKSPGKLSPKKTKNNGTNVQNISNFEISNLKINLNNILEKKHEETSNASQRSTPTRMVLSPPIWNKRKMNQFDLLEQQIKENLKQDSMNRLSPTLSETSTPRTLRSASSLSIKHNSSIHSLVTTPSSAHVRSPLMSPVFSGRVHSKGKPSIPNSMNIFDSKLNPLNHDNILIPFGNYDNLEELALYTDGFSITSESTNQSEVYVSQKEKNQIHSLSLLSHLPTNIRLELARNMILEEQEIVPMEPIYTNLLVVSPQARKEYVRNLEQRQPFTDPIKRYNREKKMKNEKYITQFSKNSSMNNNNHKIDHPRLIRLIPNKSPNIGIPPLEIKSKFPSRNSDFNAQGNSPNTGRSNKSRESLSYSYVRPMSSSTLLNLYLQNETPDVFREIVQRQGSLFHSNNPSKKSKLVLEKANVSTPLDKKKIDTKYFSELKYKSKPLDEVSRRIKSKIEAHKRVEQRSKMRALGTSEII